MWCIAAGRRTQSSIPLTVLTTTTSSTFQTQSSTSFDDDEHHVYINTSDRASGSGGAARSPTWRILHLVDSELDRQESVEHGQTSSDNYRRHDLSALETPRQAEYVNISPSSSDVNQSIYNTGPRATTPAVYERLDPARSQRPVYASISGTLQTTGSEAHDYMEPITSSQLGDWAEFRVHYTHITSRFPNNDN